MKKFVTELLGKEVMTDDGQKLGWIENFVVDTKTGDLKHVLVIAKDDVETRLYQTDGEGRIVLPFTDMKAMRDVVVMNVGY